MSSIKSKLDSLIAGQKRTVHTAIINPKKVYLPPLHIRLGLMKIFVKAMDRNRAGFMY
jgi:hypothetical protein